ncbi:hypothetical protein A3H53_00240 [Candidatus Nomurabacteria bacterium RIFCSPLOWO2_02_FULL_40_10]|uniref:SipW-cognate class signal peptide n=1 Tax=Candidatus Nomurabacteria bacterium RIFCSPLOWO2_02_FULL_40_10 TaxID=1801786 RepID=A0A1F6XYZ1_9BACT|nr:MAG: hypothetical protein A3H53_00240 [Candidatus Nomurabacteria bacterium RIFCSPLOWO2_02_FULL_40_10]
MKKILLSGVVVVAAAAVVVGATTAFFTDTETSTGNTFTAGAIDLTVDSDCHYWNYVGDDYNGDPAANEDGYVDVGCGEWVPNPQGTPEPVAVGDWEATDLGVENRFFNFSDIKPGDKGENTISLHVENNDAWLRFVVKDVTDLDNTCTEPEEGANNESCEVGDPELNEEGAGELRENLLFTIWLDNGNNVLDDDEYPVIEDEVLPEGGVTLDLKDINGTYLVGGETAYFGVAWELPSDTENEVQTDSMSATMEFQVEQVRNNPEPFETD